MVTGRNMRRRGTGEVLNRDRELSRYLAENTGQAAGTVEPLAGAELLHHPSKGSLYLNFYYDLGECTPEEVQYLDLLTDILDELARLLVAMMNCWKRMEEKSLLQSILPGGLHFVL